MLTEPARKAKSEKRAGKRGGTLLLEKRKVEKEQEKRKINTAVNRFNGIWAENFRFFIY